MNIQISGHYGDPKADNLFWPIQKSLNDCFTKHIIGVYFNALSLFSIVLRVSGKVRDFGSDGPGRMKHLKKNSEITIDMVFAENFWNGTDSENLKAGVAEGIRECIRLMIERAEVIGEIKDVECFKSDVRKAILEFLDR
jgi:hypothetical protein